MLGSMYEINSNNTKVEMFFKETYFLILYNLICQAWGCLSL